MDNRLQHEIIERRETIDQLLSRLPTHHPGIIDAFDAATGTVTVVPAVQMKVKDGSGVRHITLPKILKCPVDIPFAQVAGFALTLPIRKGDSCTIHFSQRCIDNWLRDGGVQPADDTPGASRHHSLTDAIVTVGPSPMTAVLEDWFADGLELRNRDRSVRVTLTNYGVEIYGPTTFKNAVTFEADVKFDAAMKNSAGVDIATHQHMVAGVTAGSATVESGVPE